MVEILQRFLYQKILKELTPNEVIVVYGPRRVGKTTILEKISISYSGKVKFVDGEDRNIQTILSSRTLRVLQEFIGDTDLLIVDEAQQIHEIGSNLKLLVDHIPNIKIIASGSASFSLAQKVGEPLTGRKKTLYLYPLSLRELIENFGFENHETFTRSHLLIYGGYPKTFHLDDEKKQSYLKELVESYLFRDILSLENIKNTRKLRDLLTLLAFQIGHEVSLSELGNQLDLHKDTVSRYLDLLEKSFVVVNIRGFSRNLRKEVTKSSRYYFYDNGIRNALINNFNTIPLRQDIGALWENFIVMERLKKQSYEGIIVNNYFWRTYDQQEIDWVEEREGNLYGYEIKWSPRRNFKKAPGSWSEAYPDARFECITSENYLDFV